MGLAEFKQGSFNDYTPGGWEFDEEYMTILDGGRFYCVDVPSSCSVGTGQVVSTWDAVSVLSFGEYTSGDSIYKRKNRGLVGMTLSKQAQSFWYSTTTPGYVQEVLQGRYIRGYTVKLFAQNGSFSGSNTSVDIPFSAWSNPIPSTQLPANVGETSFWPAVGGDGYLKSSTGQVVGLKKKVNGVLQNYSFNPTGVSTNPFVSDPPSIWVCSKTLYKIALVAIQASSGYVEGEVIWENSFGSPTTYAPLALATRYRRPVSYNSTEKYPSRIGRLRVLWVSCSDGIIRKIEPQFSYTDVCRNRVGRIRVVYEVVDSLTSVPKQSPITPTL